MIEVDRGSDNVYADLGFPDAEEMQIKSRLVSKINEIIKDRQWTRREAAEALTLTHSRLSKVLRGQFQNIEQRELLSYLTKLGCDVKIVIGPERGDSASGRIDVVFTA